MKYLIIIYLILAFLYFCRMYHNTYEDIRKYKKYGYNVKTKSGFEILIVCLLRSFVFPIDYFLHILRGTI